VNEKKKNTSKQAMHLVLFYNQNVTPQVTMK